MASSPQTLPKSDILRQLEEFDTLFKLRQGYKVTDVEKETLLSLASGAEAEARSADGEIARLRAVLLELERSRDSLLKAASQARSLFAPIRKVPPEILGEIFFLTYSSIQFSDGALTAGRGMPTVLTGEVCSSWRDIAVSTRKLWACITITMEHGLQVPPWQLQRFKKVLELSGDVLLDLTVETAPWITPFQQMRSSVVFPLLYKHSQRWKHLTLDGHPGFLAEFFRPDLSPGSFNSESSSLSLRLPSLNSLKLVIAGITTHGELHIPATSAPNFRYVSIMKKWHLPSRLSIELPWEQLGMLTFGVDHLSEFFDALSKATSVTQVCLYDCLSLCEGQTQLLRSISSNTLTNLRFRLIDDITYDAMSICFDNFTLPHLRELHIYGQLLEGHDYYHVPEWPIDPFKAFVDRSAFPITVLSILNVPMRDSTLVTMLACLPRLEVLIVKEPRSDRFSEGDRLSCLTNRLLERLRVHVREPVGKIDTATTRPGAYASLSDSNHEAGDSDSGQRVDLFLPHLKEVSLKGKGSPDTFSFETFLKMVQSRRAHLEGSMSILKTIELQIWNQPVDEAVRKEIDSLRLCHDDLVLDVVSLMDSGSESE
jgi:hypothetical protein